MIVQKIQGFDYFVSDDGEVYNKKAHKISKWVVNTGYYQVQLHREGKVHYKYVHRLVAETLLQNPEGLPQVDHIDNNKLNNHPSNLRWIDNKRNTQKGYDEGAYQYKQRCHVIKATDKVTEETVLFKSIRDLSEKLGYNRKTVTAILKGVKTTNNYGHVFEYAMEEVME